MNRVCLKCNIEKDISQFYKSKRTKSGYENRCISCKRARENELAFINRDKIAANRRKWRSNPDNKAKEKESRSRNYIKNIDKRRAYGIQYNKDHPEVARKKRIRKSETLKGKMQGWILNARSRGIEWRLTLEYLESLERFCFYTGRELTLKIKEENTLSLDRIDSSRGYVEDNVVFCCADINKMKNKFALEYFLRIVKEINNFKN